MKQRDHQKVCLALRVRFVNMSRDERLKTWYQYPQLSPEEQLAKWRTYPTHRYPGRIAFAAICTADGARNGQGEECHLYEYDTWPNGTRCWLTKEQADHVRSKARERSK